MKRSTLSFWLFFGVSTILVCSGARQICPAVSGMVRPEVFSFRDKFLSSYGPVDLTEYILWHDVLGAGKQVGKKDLLLLGSSKMMYGVDARLLEQGLESRGVKMGVYNMAFGRGEGIVFPALLLKRLGIRNKLAVIDATDNTGSYHLESAAEAAMTSSRLGAWKVILETNLQFRTDWFLHSLVPRGKIDARGMALEAFYLRPWLWRDWKSGDVINHHVSSARYRASPGTFRSYFDPDRTLRRTVFSVFDNLNLDYGFISIPYTGNDPKWARQAATDIGRWYLPVESTNLYTVDGVHLTEQSMEIFTRSLVDALMQGSFGLATRLSNIRSGHSVELAPALPESSPHLLQSVEAFNVVLFQGRYYCVPHGLVVDWERDNIEQLPGVAVRRSLQEALELIRSGQMPPSPTPFLLTTVKSFNIVLFNGRYYCVPHGSAVDWQKDDVAKLPGVMIRRSLQEAIGAIEHKR
jgi:hypothetical protein